MCPRVTTSTAGLLARGSLPCAAFPVAQWRNGARLSAYSCGGSRGIGLTPSPRSLSIPEGNRQVDDAWVQSLASMTGRSIWGRFCDDPDRDEFVDRHPPMLGLLSRFDR